MKLAKSTRANHGGIEVLLVLLILLFGFFIGIVQFLGFEHPNFVFGPNPLVAPGYYWQEGMPGVLVLPEFYLGTLAPLLILAVALLIYQRAKRKPLVLK